MLSFNQIPIDIRTPGQYIEFDNSRAVQGLPGQPHKILVVGQRLSSGTVAEAVPKQILSAAQGEEYFGRGSILAQMLAALKAANNRTECWAVALDDDGAAVQATGKITITGPATAAGTLQVYVAGNRIPVAVADADTQDTIAAAVVAAINAETDLPLTAAVNGTNANEADLTARHGGELGNDIDVRINYQTGERTPAGVGVTITALSGGATNPDISTALTAIGDEQYHTIITPYTDAGNLTEIETLLSDRWGPMIAKEGHAFSCDDDTHAGLTTLGDARNSPHVTIMGAQGSPTPPWQIAAVVGAVDAAEPDPARPRQYLHLTGVAAPAVEDRYTRAERDLHLHDGISTAIVDDGGRVLIERLITTYQTNAASVPDTSYLDVATMRTLAYLRYTVRARIALRYPRHKLADDGTQFGAGQAVVTPSIVRAELLGLFREWEDAALVEDFEQFKDELVVERNSSDPNRLDAIIPPNVINQLRVFAASVQFIV